METRTMERKQLDLKLLFEELEDDPNNSRTHYYLGQTYNLLQNYEKAFHYFIERMNHPNVGFLQEKIDAVFEAARIANFKLNKPWSECEDLYLKAYMLDNKRPDSLYFLGIHYYLTDNKFVAFNYFKEAFHVGYPLHCQYSLKPTLSFHFLPKFLTELCYYFQDYELGEKSAKLFLEKNAPSDEIYNLMLSWYNIFVKLNTMNLKVNISLNLPENKPLLCFVADGGFEPWTGSDILNKGVGGSETYIIEMARYIQKQGFFKVIVFCNCLSQSVFENVEYIPIINFGPFANNNNIHTCIISRFSEYIPLAIKSKANNVYLVLHDLTPSGLIIPIDPKLKNIFCLSEWHVKYFLNIFPQFENITVPFYYGIDIHKFDNEIVKNYVNEFHPECYSHNYDEIAKLMIVTKNQDGIIIDPLHRTIPYLTKYEKARILGQRAKQIETGAKPLVRVPETIVDAYIIAELELKEKRIPFIIRRPIPGGGSEYWNLKDLEIIAF